jgi:hypothetical protein
MKLTMTIKTEELYKALKEIEAEAIEGFEMLYFYYEAGVFHFELFISEDTQEWYEGDDHRVEYANFGRLWRPFADVEELPYIISFIETALDGEDFVDIEFTNDYLELKTSEATLHINESA